MRIRKIFNNNVVATISDNKSEIITETRERLSVECNDSAILSLAEHIDFAIERVRSGIDLPNLIMNEIRSMYPEAFRLGNWARLLIIRKTGIFLPDDEAGYIALHIISATIGTEKNEAAIIIEFVRDVITIFEEIFAVSVTIDSPIYDRFVVHLKFFVSRILEIQKKETKLADIPVYDMYDLLLQKDQHMNEFLNSVKYRVQQKFKYEMNVDESVYIMIHVLKILNDTRIKK